MKLSIWRTSALASLALVGGIAHAGQVFSSSYAMPNGQGNEVGGTYNYWDGNYAGGSGNPLQSLSPLSGGHGQLTNGAITNQPWYLVSNEGGTGAYVGWLTVDPTITFSFSSSVTINSVTLNLDASRVGGVFLPEDVKIDGTQYNVDDTMYNGGAPIEVTFSGLHLTGDTLSIELDRQPNTWVFLNQAQFFNNSSSTPSPAALLPFAGGLVAFARRRLRK